MASTSRTQLSLDSSINFIRSIPAGAALTLFSLKLGLKQHSPMSSPKQPSHSTLNFFIAFQNVLLSTFHSSVIFTMTVYSCVVLQMKNFDFIAGSCAFNMFHKMTFSAMIMLLKCAWRIVSTAMKTSTTI